MTLNSHESIIVQKLRQHESITTNKLYELVSSNMAKQTFTVNLHSLRKDGIVESRKVGKQTLVNQLSEAAKSSDMRLFAEISEFEEYIRLLSSLISDGKTERQLKIDMAVYNLVLKLDPLLVHAVFQDKANRTSRDMKIDEVLLSAWRSALDTFIDIFQPSKREMEQTILLLEKRNRFEEYSKLKEIRQHDAVKAHTKDDSLVRLPLDELTSKLERMIKQNLEKEIQH